MTRSPVNSHALVWTVSICMSPWSWVNIWAAVTDWGKVEHYGIGQLAQILFPLSPLTCRRRVILTAQLLLVSPMASLLRVVATSCSSPLFSGLACAKTVRTVKTPCVRFFRTHQALSRLASPGNGAGILSRDITHSVLVIVVTWGGWGHLNHVFPLSKTLSMVRLRLSINIICFTSADFVIKYNKSEWNIPKCLSTLL